MMSRLKEPSLIYLECCFISLLQKKSAHALSKRREMSVFAMPSLVLNNTLSIALTVYHDIVQMNHWIWG